MKKTLLTAFTKGTVGAMGRRVTKDKILAAMTSSGKSGVIGGVIDGFLGSAEAVKLYKLEYIDEKTAAKHATNEAACGFFTATAGTLGTTVAALALGTMGPTALVVGMGASVGARWFYRKNSESVLPDLESDLPLGEEEEKDLEELMKVMKTMGVNIPEEELRAKSENEDEDEGW